MHVDLALVKQEVDIDDTKIKLELDDELSDSSNDPISLAGEALKMICGDDSEIFSTPFSDRSQDERKSMVRKGSSSSQQQALEGNKPKPFECRICHFLFEKHLDISAHMVDHQINRHFCNFGCGAWLDSLEKILEHEYRHHSRPGHALCCRICDFVANDADHLASHMQSHVYVYRFVCAICRRHFESIEGIERHRENSRYLCGQLEYIDGASTRAELVAVSAEPVAGQVLCDVQIKDEPLEVEEIVAQVPMEIIKAEPQDAEEMHDVCVKEEPDHVEQTINSCGNFWSSIPNPLRSKLRLPAVKPSNAQMKPKSIAVVNEIRPSDGKQSSILQLPSHNRRILPKKPAQTAANILKALPTNCMVIKLPPNTKIIKMVGQAAPQAVNKSNIYVQNIQEKSISTATAIPRSITISQVKPEAGNSISPVHIATSLPPQTLRNSTLLHDAFNKAESHPESMKIISEFRNQILSIEKTLPLPGTVLQSATARSNYPPVSAKMAALVNAPKPMELFLNPMSVAMVKDLRVTHPQHGFLYSCPVCHRSYEQNYAIRMHLISNHNMSQEQLNNLKVILMPYKLLSQDPLPVESRQEVQNSYSDDKVANVVSQLSDASVATPTTPPTIGVKDALSPLTKAKPAKASPTKRRSKADQTKCSEFQCAECSKTFTTLGALRIHKSIHTGELPYKCDYCDKHFRTPGQVRVHHRRHTGEKPFKCKVCSLDFTHRETLISHLSRHIGMKRYKCYGCDKYFVVVSGLRAHRRLRPDTCGKVKFTARAHGPRVRVVRGEVLFEPHPEHNGYLRSEDPLNILTERAQTSDLTTENLN